MRIGIYTFNIKAGRSGGVQQYSAWLIQAFLTHTRHEIFVFTNPGLARMDYRSFHGYKNYHEIILPFRIKIYRIIINNKLFIKIKLGKFIDFLHRNKIFFLIFGLLGDVRSIIYKYNIDVLHFPTQIMPYFNWRIPTLISLHDLQHEYRPEFFTEKRINARRFFYGLSAGACSHIIVTFDHVKKDLIKYLNIVPEKISVTSIGYNIPKKWDGDLSNASVLGRFNIPKNFILYPARTWKHKNHILLLETVGSYKDLYGNNIFLVCTGGKNEYYQIIEKKIIEKGLKKNVVFTDYLSEKDLFFLFKKTKLVVIPTLYEAGSGPLLQAMFFGAPVICSNVTSLPETIGDSRFIFDPNNKDELCELMHKMLTDEEFRQENIENSKKQFSRFDWENIIKNFLSAYEKAIKNYKNELK